MVSVKEEIVTVPQQPLANTQLPSVVEPVPPVVKETVKENVDKKGVKKPVPVEAKSPEPESHPQPALAEVAVSSNGKR